MNSLDQSIKDVESYKELLSTIKINDCLDVSKNMSAHAQN